MDTTKLEYFQVRMLDDDGKELGIGRSLQLDWQFATLAEADTFCKSRNESCWIMDYVKASRVVTEFIDFNRKVDSRICGYYHFGEKVEWYNPTGLRYYFKPKEENGGHIPYTSHDWMYQVNTINTEKL